MKRRKTIRAGRLVWDITYTVPRPNASKQERKRVREVTEEQVARTNANTAQRKLEMLMATNFDEGDLVLTVTYRDADLPDSADVTRKHLGKVFAQMRAYRKARGLPDLKYMSSRLGERYSHAADYFETASAAIAEMVRQTGEPDFDDKSGLMKKGVIVRHLVLPGCTADSKKVISYLYHTYGDRIYISIMNQFTPVCDLSSFPELNRRITAREYEKIVDYALDIGVENGFIQEGNTAEESFIPEFDGEGL